MEKREGVDFIWTGFGLDISYGALTCGDEKDNEESRDQARY
jgi:hypothetical protein